MKTVLFDVDTQVDFLLPSGALYAPGAERIVERVAALSHWAGSRRIPVISTVDAHAENDPEFRVWPPHCVAGTNGQRKPASTLLDSRAVVPNAGNPPELGDARQILLEKQSVDCFTAMHLSAILDRLAAERYIVCGVVTEVCVKNAVLGLLKTGRRVELVTDAIKEFESTAAAKFLSEFAGAGGIMTTSAALMS